MKKWFLGSVFGLVVGIGIAISFGVFASSETATRSVTISISGLPNGRTVDVWGDSKKLISFQSDHPVQKLVVPSNLDKIEVNSQPGQRRVFYEQIGKEVTESVEPGVGYFTEKPQYNPAGTNILEVVFKKKYALSLGTSATVRGTNTGASANASEKIQFNPASKDGFYDAGSRVTVTIPKIKGMHFAYWVIKDASSGNVSSDIREFSSADNPLQVTLDHPINLFGHFVGEWEQLPDQPNSDGIVVQNIVDGQKVKLIQNGISVVEKTVGKDGTEAKLPVGLGKQLDGHFIITAPDGKTEIFQSPHYDNLQAGNRFFY